RPHYAYDFGRGHPVQGGDRNWQGSDGAPVARPQREVRAIGQSRLPGDDGVLDRKRAVRTREGGLYRRRQATRRPDRRSSGGTVFFDEFGELPQRIQVKLLCLLQDRCIRRVGSTRPIEVDVLVVAATNRDLDAMVASEQFRDDLIYRFDEQIVIPPLRLRRDDIPLLADRFLQQECEKLERRIKQAMQRERTPIPAPANMTTNNQRSRLQFAFSEAARDRLARYDYPGNVRELQKIVSKAVG